MKLFHGKAVIPFILIFAFIFLCGTHTAMAAASKSDHLAVELKAKSAILMDENGVILFEKNSHEALPPASVTKVMTLLLAVEAVESGRVGLSDQVTASENAWRQGGSQIWLEAGESMTYHEMLIALAVVSANDAAVALMEHIYGSEQAAVAAMNERAQQLGLKNTRFSNVNGLPIDQHLMSTFDTAQIVREAVKHPLYMEVCGTKEYWLRGGKNWLVNTNKLLWWYTGADGLKTGWTQEAQYCFAGTAKRDGLRLISVVFAAPEPRSHLKESMKLLDWGFANFKSVQVVQANEPVAQSHVAKGMIPEVSLLAARDLQVLVKKGDDAQVEKQVIADSELAAPLERGDKCGELLVLKDGVEYGRVDLIAGEPVQKAGFLRTLQLMFASFFAIQ